MVQRCIPRNLLLYGTEYALVSIRYDTYLPIRANDMDPNKP